MAWEARAAARETELPALVYLRLSLYLRPSSDLTAVTLASLFEQLKQSDQAIAAYQLVPSSSPLKMARRHPDRA